ncbi:hypothetical protein P348_04558 [Enterobacter sp. DC3]|nr:hypothetical protein P348_04558 [Enterobacter sp. DC3]EWG78138.1 hypothetical protein P349_00941 [Enterobacter sp. DC4]
MLANVCQFMLVRIAQIGNIKIGTVRGSCPWGTFAFPSRKEVCCMEPSDKVRIICTESKHCSVSVT